MGGTGECATARAPSDAVVRGKWDVFLVSDGRYGRARFPSKGCLRLDVVSDWRDIRVPVEKGVYCGDWPLVPKLKPNDKPDIGRPV